MKKIFFLFLLIFCSGAVFAQKRTLTGNVKDATGNPLPNISVTVRGARTGTSTDAAGNYSLAVSPADKTIVFSSVGFTTKELTIGSQTSVSVKMEASNAGLEEIVITGYTREKKSNYAGATSRVNAKAINEIPNASIDQVLQGRAPGLYVTAGSGQPGTAANVIIRGIGTINGSSAPLYIMDGIPIQAEAFAALSASDIASVDILKDAAATSLYGSRGSNGVIVITTKRGRNTGRTVFGVKAQGGFSNRTQPKFEVMNAAQRINYEEEVGVENGVNIGPGFTYSRKNPANANLPATTLAGYDKIRDSLSNTNYDWINTFFRQGTFQEYEVNASGGSEKMNFYSAVNYYKQDGIARRSGLERYSLRNNIDFRSERFSANVSSTINFARSSFIEAENSTAVVNPFAAAYYALPYEVPYINGVLVHPGLAASYGVLDQREGTAALERMLATTSKRNEIKGVLGASFRYKIIDGLSAVSTLGLDFRELMSERYFNPNTYTGTLPPGGQGSFNETANREIRLIANGGLNYNKTFAEKHLVDVSALYENIKNTTRIFGYTGYGLNPLLSGTPAAVTPGSATGFIPLINGRRDISALQSVIAIARYTYNDKYTFNANYRYDGSSSVPESKRWHSFYSFGASWNALKESFMENSTVLSDLQLRASYGISASPFSSSFGYLPTYSSTGVRYGGVAGLALSQIGNDTYDWEYAKSTNIGADFSVLKKRIRGSVDVYVKKTENLFISQQLPAEAGATSLNINAGTMQNKGIEVALSGDIITGSKFRWSVGGNASYNKNEITSLGQVNEFPSGTSIIRVGLPYGTHYIVKWAGVDAATGEGLYYNRDGTITTAYNSSTQSVADFGSYLPKYQGGFNTSFSYGGFYLEGFFSFAAGNKRFNNEDYFNENASFATSNQSIKVLERWRKPGDVTNIQKFGTARRFSSKDIQDCSFVRFRNLNIGYNVPKEMIARYARFFSALTIYAQGQNLFTWTNWRGFDPEDNNNISTFEYPAARTYTLGINVSL
ncbi:MAG: SusC/RagA family TonB-linked outer membrane protein [Chitinophagaceae bacterium]